MKKLFVLLWIFWVSALMGQCEFVVIVHPKSTIDKITEEQLENIFLAKTRRLPDGSRARPVELGETDLKSAFYQIVADKSEVELRSYWATMLFTGSREPPKQFRTIDQLISYVISNPGAIAYVCKEAADETVKVLTLGE